MHALSVNGIFQPTVTEKGWGCEKAICNFSERGYAGKLLIYDRTNATSSTHYHLSKHETFHVLSGEFNLGLIDLQTAEPFELSLKAGDCIAIRPGNPHRLRCVEPGTIIEFSTPDDAHDNYRIAPGDSQAAGSIGGICENEANDRC